MLSLSPATRIFLALSPIDGRKSFNGLSILVQETLQQEPTSGFLFVFVNKARNRLKILFWDGSGLVLYTKRLVSHCPLYRICKAALSVSPIVSRGRRVSGNRWRAIRHARHAIARWDAAWDSGLDVR
jgi:transposase